MTGTATMAAGKRTMLLSRRPPHRRYPTPYSMRYALCLPCRPAPLVNQTGMARGLATGGARDEVYTGGAYIGCRVRRVRKDRRPDYVRAALPGKS